MQVETVVTLELNQVLGSSSEEGQAVRETAGAARASAEPGQGVPATSASGFLHFHHKVFALFRSVCNTNPALCSEPAAPKCESNTRALGRGGDSRQGESAEMPR